MFKRSTDNGNTWPDSLIISHYDSIGGQRAVIDVDTFGNMHACWYDYKYSPYAWTGDIFYRASRDSGNSWEEIDSLTVMHRAVASDILAEGNNLHLVWEDDRHGFNNNFEIYYRQSTDLGESWRNEVRLTDTLYWSICPSLAYGSGYLHLFWRDCRDSANNGIGAIYYKRKNLVGIEETKNHGVNCTGLSLNCATILKRNSLIYYNLKNSKKGEITILDVTGRAIDKFPVHQSSGNFVLNINKEVEKGIYFLMLKAGDEYITRKILVVR